jgi:hypothetical protein
MGLNSVNIDNDNINYGDMNKNNADYFQIITPEYTYNARLEYGEGIDVLEFLQINDSITECISIDIPKLESNVAYLNIVNYRSTCAKNLQKGTGTVHVIKTALKYLCDNYKNIHAIKLKDTTIINEAINPSIADPVYITTRRLLLGKKGWYEENFSAVPIENTIGIISFLRDRRSEFEDVIAKNKPNEWWSYANTKDLIKRILLKIKKNVPMSLWEILSNTDWLIEKKVIRNFQIVYEIQQEGGAFFEKNVKNMNRYYMPTSAKRRNK